MPGRQVRSHKVRRQLWAAPVLAGAAALLAACGSSASPTSTGASSQAGNQPVSQQNTTASTVTIMTKSTSAGTVLTNAAGHTLYWFAIDTPTKSNCSGTCASYWPPVLGKPVAASGTSLPDGFSSISRSGGKVQATYDGHPLYTYAADTSAGQVSGNGINTSGGLWWAMTPTGSKLSKASSSSSGGGGY
jgi:predicted lipoprotein with Yx(FWY)xxD motif